MFFVSALNINYMYDYNIQGNEAKKGFTFFAVHFPSVSEPNYIVRS